MTMRLFAQLTKVDAAKRLIIGRACQQVLDRTNEVFDYEKSKPYFKAWSDEIQKDTDGKSYGNVRAMHGKVSAGKIAEPLVFNDEAKAIDIAVKVVDDNEWNKTLEGCYTGFSIGGSYVGDKVACKIDGTDAQLYVANPNEISLVDRPCVPTAKFFEVVKADGAVEKVAFKPGDLDVQVEGTDEDVKALGELMAEKGLSLAAVITMVKAKITPAMDKGMWNVQDFASALACIANIAASAENDAQWEGDASPVPEKLRAWLADGVSIFKAMAKEETDELLASLKTGANTGAMLAYMDAARGARAIAKAVEAEGADLSKIAAPLLAADEVSALAKGEPAAFKAAIIAKAGANAVQKIHDMLGEMGAKCNKVAEGDMRKADGAPDVVKLAADLAAANERIKKLEAQPMPHPATVTLRTVTKGQPVNGEPPVDPSTITLADIPASEFIKNLDGSIDYATTLHVAREKAAIKLAQAQA